MLLIFCKEVLHKVAELDYLKTIDSVEPTESPIEDAPEELTDIADKLREILDSSSVVLHASSTAARP
jgi:hypothetical protein